MLITVNRKVRVNGIWEAFEKKISRRIYLKDYSGGFYRMVFVIDGTLVFQSGEEKIVLKAGEYAVRKGGDTVFAEGSKVAKAIIISLDISGIYTERLCNSSHILTADGVEKFNRVLNLMKNVGGTESNYLKNLNSSYLHELANNLELFLLCVAEDGKPVRNEQITLSAEFKDIVEVMRENVEKSLTVREIAALCGMSESSLKKIFAKYSACSVHKYFLKMKIFKAIELLDDKYNVAEISEKLSFNNQNYFGIVFKKETGYSPLNYRKKFLRGN